MTDPLGNATGFGYDENGNRMLVTDPKQNNTTYTYNFRGLPTQRTDALGAITTFAYGGSGCQTCNGGGEKLTALTDAAGSTTSFTYDQRGLLTAITDPLLRITSLAYNSIGRTTGKTDRNGTTLAYGYTASGKLSTVTYPDQSQVVNNYDNLDRLTGTSEPLGVSSYIYDAAGRITGYTDPHGFTVSYIYDAAGNLTQITYPDSTTVTYAYDTANRLTSVTDWASGQASFTYDQAGRLATSTQFNGIVTTFSYDIASRLTGMTSAVASYQFTLDGNGNRTNSVENEPVPPALTPGSAIYGYNAQRNRLLSAGDVDYTYDNEGQLATAGGGTVLTFNCDHRLAEINNSGTIHQYSYSANGNRPKVTRDGVETRYIYDPFGNLLAEADSQYQITRKYIYGNGLLAAVTPSGRYCYHFNPTGSTIAVTDMTQAVVNAYAYEPFGQILAQQETFPQPFKFVGRFGVMAEPNGLYYMRARYYDPSVGRFISEDPIGFVGGDVNLYGYVLNDPVNRIDPSGLKPGDVFMGADAAARDAVDYVMSHFSQGNGDTEYGGWIYKLAGAIDPSTGEPYYSYTEPVAGTPKNIAPSKFNQPCQGNVKHSIYHTHPGNAYNVGDYSDDDNLWASFHGYPVYLGTSSGLVRGYIANNFDRWPGPIYWRVRDSY